MDTPGIVGSAEFTLNWVIAPFEDLTNQSREEAFKNRLKHSSFGGGHTSDHVPLLNADIVVPDDCYRSMQAFHSPLYVMCRKPGDIIISGDVSIYLWNNPWPSPKRQFETVWTIR